MRYLCVAVLYMFARKYDITVKRYATPIFSNTRNFVYKGWLISAN